MDRRMAVSWLTAGVALLVLAAAAFWGGAALRAVVAPAGATAFAAEGQQPAYPGPEAYGEKVVLDGEEHGIVVLGANQPLQVQTSAGGFSGYERALVVVSRLNTGLAAGLQGEQVQAEQYDGQWVVVGAGNNLITVNQAEADARSLTREELADIWAANLRVAVAAAWQSPAPAEGEAAEEEFVEQPPAEEVAEAEPSEQQPPAGEEEAEEPTVAVEEWQPEEPYKNKIVAIVSFGEGARLGIARVNGPQSAVNQVQAVAQLETSYKDYVDIEIYVPISTKKPGQILARVQGVGVTGVGDLRIR